MHDIKSLLPEVVPDLCKFLLNMHFASFDLAPTFSLPITHSIFGSNSYLKSNFLFFFEETAPDRATGAQRRVAAQLCRQFRQPDPEDGVRPQVGDGQQLFQGQVRLQDRRRLIRQPGKTVGGPRPRPATHHHQKVATAVPGKVRHPF